MPRILFSNGGPYSGPFPYADLVHQATEDALNIATSCGEPAGRSAHIPHGFHFRPRTAPLSTDEKHALRKALDLPTDRKIVVSVGALDVHHKRHDHLIREVAQLGAHRPFLLCLGQAGPETDTLLRVAGESLGSEDFTARSLPYEEVQDHCDAADVFALASVVEAFGRAYVEGADAGIPCVAHDFPVAREVLGPWGHYVDMVAPGALASELRRALAPARNRSGAEQVEWVRGRYSWDVLRAAYVAMIERAAVIDPRPRRLSRARH